MKDPTKQLQDAYFTLLNGNVEINGTEIPIYKWSRTADDTRVSIGEVIMDDESTHDTYMLDVRQSIYVQTELNFGDQRETAAQICDEVVQLVVADTLMVMSDFTMVSVYLDSSEFFENDNTDSTSYIKELVFKHLIAEK